jgi:hypothetical protein
LWSGSIPSSETTNESRIFRALLLKCASVDNNAAQQIVGRERREREAIVDFQLPIVDLNRAAASTQPFDAF